MAEGLAALTIAGAVVQFVDFAITVVSKGNEYRKSTNGMLKEHESLNYTATRLKELSKELDQSISTLTRETKSSPEEVALQNVAKACQEASDELVTALDDLRCKGDTTHWKSARHALKSMWAKDAIEKKAQTLCDARSQVIVHFLVVFRKNSDASFRKLSEENRTGKEAILAAIGSLKNEVGEDFIRVLRAIEVALHTNLPTPEEWKPPPYRPEPGVTAARKLTREEEILLASLVFPNITERHDSIALAHQETFKWIFGDTLKNTAIQHDIVRWFRDPEAARIYWVSGKPGSGKSTLMRYLADNRQNDSKTQDNLEAWAADRTLLKASCYFWAAGTSMQKSMGGLMQSLLYEICRQDPNQLSKLPPRNQSSNSKASGSKVAELTNALEAIIESTSNTHAICLFVDGLDEFEGTNEDREDLVKIFKKLSQYPNVKMCLASRDWLVFKDPFESGPHLRLQDLTREDITNYVKKELEEHPRFLELRKSENEESTKVVSEITDRAEGVFLWVILVVRSLLEGLRNEDKSEDLIRRLKVIPSDLEAYFHLIIQSIEREKFYFPQSCQVFQTVMEAKIDLSLPTLLFANDQNWFESATRLRDELKEPLAQQLLSMRRRLNVLCKGLLEVHERKGHNTMFQFKIDYLHRTVHDFLFLPEVKEKIDNGTPKNFDAQLALGQAHLAQIILLDKEGAITAGYNNNANLGDLMKLTDKVLGHALALEDSTKKPPIELLDILGKTLDSISSVKDWDALTTSHVDHPGILSHCGPEFWHNWALWKNSFLSLMISTGLKLYAIELLDHQQNAVTEKKGRPLLDYALRRGLQATKPWRKAPNVDIVRKLLQLGADPNQKWQDATVWGLFLEALQKLPDPVPDGWLQATELLIEHGATQNAAVSHAKMIPARRMDSNRLLLSQEVDLSDTGNACLSRESIIEAETVLLRVFEGKDATRLKKMLKGNQAGGKGAAPTQKPKWSATPKPASRGWKGMISMVFRTKKKVVVG